MVTTLMSGLKSFLYSLAVYGNTIQRESACCTLYTEMTVLVLYCRQACMHHLQATLHVDVLLVTSSEPL